MSVTRVLEHFFISFARGARAPSSTTPLPLSLNRVVATFGLIAVNYNATICLLDESPHRQHIIIYQVSLTRRLCAEHLI